jgi:hypothetical protein
MGTQRQAERCGGGPGHQFGFHDLPPKPNGRPFAAYSVTRSKDDLLLSNFNQSLTIVARIPLRVTNPPQRSLFQKVGPSKEAVLAGQISARL